MVAAARSKSSPTLIRASKISRGDAEIASVETTLITLRIGPTATPGETPMPFNADTWLLMRR